jgi:replicative DNA helicase
MLAQPDHPVSQPPPHNLDLEQQVIGAILLRNDLFHDVSPPLMATHFFEPLHGAIFDTIERLIASGKPVDPFTLDPFFANVPPIDAETTVKQYIGKIAANAASLRNARAYADILIDLAVRRTIIVTGEDFIADAYATDDGRTAADLIEEVEARLYAVAPKAANEKSEVTLAEAMRTAIAAANEAHQRGSGLAGYSTGLRALDEKIGGLARGNLIIGAGRPSMGKTALMINIADNLVRDGIPVGFWSLEMMASELSTRILARHAGVPVHKIARGTFNVQEMASLIKAENALREYPMTLDITGGISISQLHARARRLHRSGRLEVMFVDYLQLMTTGRRSTGNRVADITEITNGLKAIAKELNVPVVALSQLSRAVETRDNRRPQLSDLRESGSIEQDADVVLMMYRDDYYVEREKPPPSDQAKYSDWLRRLDAVRGKAEVIVAKARQGTLGTVELTFEGATTTFADLEVGAPLQ